LTKPIPKVKASPREGEVERSGSPKGVCPVHRRKANQNEGGVIQPKRKKGRRKKKKDVPAG